MRIPESIPIKATADAEVAMMGAIDGSREYLKRGAEKAWDEVKTAFHSTVSKFK